MQLHLAGASAAALLALGPRATSAQDAWLRCVDTAAAQLAAPLAPDCTCAAYEFGPAYANYPLVLAEFDASVGTLYAAVQLCCEHFSSYPQSTDADVTPEMIEACLSTGDGFDATPPATQAAATTAPLSCPEELAAAEACMPGDLSDIDCTLCGVDAWGDNFENLFDNEGYCAAWTACAEAKCPAECLDEWNAYTACQLDFDCLGASGGALSTAPAAETTAATAPMDFEAPTLVDGALVTVQSPYDVDRGWTVISDDYVELAQESATVFKLVVPGLTGQEGTVTFEERDRPGYYLRHQGFTMRSNVDDGSELFKNDATFVLEAGLNSGIDRVSFRSVNFPSMFITHNDLAFYEIYRLIIKTEFLSADYRRPATFLLQDAGAGLVTTTTPAACTDTADYEDMYGDGCDYYESDPNYPLFCESFGTNGEAGSTPNENCCACIAAIGATVPATTTPQATATTAATTTPSSGCSSSSASPCPCFADKEELQAAVDDYTAGGAACRKGESECEVVQTYGWPIGSWCTSDVTDMYELFRDKSSFNDDLFSWDTSQVTDMAYMFANAASFNGDVSDWDTSKVTSTRQMFDGASSFKQDLCSWGVHFDADFSWTYQNMFLGTSCPNQNDPAGPGTNWCAATCDSTSRCPDDGRKSFADKEELQAAVDDYTAGGAACVAGNSSCEVVQTYGWPIGSWCTSDVTDMSWLFQGKRGFNEDLSSWDTSQVTSMEDMFSSAESFNQDLPWDTSQVTSMAGMFWDAWRFNGDVSNFDTSKVTSMWEMFEYAKTFNRDVSRWDVASVTDMQLMFGEASSFSHDLCAWGVHYSTDVKYGDMFLESSCLNQNDPAGPDTNWCAATCDSQSGSDATTTAATTSIATTTKAAPSTVPAPETTAARPNPIPPLDVGGPIHNSNGVVPSFFGSGYRLEQGVSWDLIQYYDSTQQSLVDVIGGEENLGRPDPINLVLDTGNCVIFGYGNCNGYGGVLDEITESSVTISRVTHGMTGCGTNIYREEKAYFRLFDGCVEGLYGCDKPRVNTFAYDVKPDGILELSRVTENGVYPVGVVARFVRRETSLAPSMSESPPPPIAASEQPSESSSQSSCVAPPVDAGTPDPIGSGADECAAEAAAVEACTPTDLSALEAYLECALCGVEAMGEDVLSLNEADYCAKWTPCTLERCPVECQDQSNALQACELGWDCLGTASGTDGSTETPDKVDSSAGAVVVNACATGLLAIAAVFVLC